MNRFEEIRDHYKNGIITEAEAINELLNLLDSDNIEKIAISLPNGIIRIANENDLGLTALTFKRNRWERLFYCYPEFLDSQTTIDEKAEVESEYFREKLRVIITKGIVFRVKNEFNTIVNLQFKAPYSDSYEVKLKAGSIIKTIKETFAEETKIECIPLDYNNFENAFIKDKYPSSVYYNCYYLLVTLKHLENNCERLDSIKED